MLVKQIRGMYIWPQLPLIPTLDVKFVNLSYIQGSDFISDITPSHVTVGNRIGSKIGIESYLSYIVGAVKIQPGTSISGRNNDLDIIVTNSSQNK